MALNIRAPFTWRTPKIQGHWENRQAEQDVLGKELDNVFNRIRNETAREKNIADIGLTKAQTRHQHAAAHGLELGNPYIPRSREAEIRGKELENRKSAIEAEKKEEFWKLFGPLLQEMNPNQQHPEYTQPTQQFAEPIAAAPNAGAPAPNFTQSQVAPKQPGLFEPGMPYENAPGIPRVNPGISRDSAEFQTPTQQMMGEELDQSMQRPAQQISPQQAKMQKLQELLNHPIFGPMVAKELDIPVPSANLHGVAGEAKDLQRLLADPTVSPDIKEKAKKAYDAKIKGDEILNDYRKKLMQNADKRAATQQAKMQMERNDILHGIMPGSDPENPVYLSPEEQDRMLAQYDNELYKKTTDPETRSKIRYATNIEKTINNIDVDALTQYAGLYGSAKQTRDQLQAMTGKARSDYMKYQTSLTNANLLVSQVRQFYGASVQESSIKHLESLTNPGTWKNNPQIAKANFEAFTRTMGQEIDTFREAVNNPTGVYSPFKGQKGSGPLITIRNNRTGETRQVTKEEAKELGVSHE